MSAAGPLLLAGASGLVGSRVLAALLATARGPRVLAPVRRPLPTTHRRLTVLEADLADAAGDAALADRLRAATPKLATYVCCLGTTIRTAGSREAFLAVDRDLVLRLGAVARELGARQAVFVSSVGASAQSGNFYLRVKGETERGLAALGFERIDVLRPGLLIGERSESRRVERLAQRFLPKLDVLLPGRLQRYRSIAADDVAAAAVALLGTSAKGVHVHEFAALEALAHGR
jgi:uncharacterized protein YbjT (DUF2867 family)